MYLYISVTHKQIEWQLQQTHLCAFEFWSRSVEEWTWPHQETIRRRGEGQVHLLARVGVFIFKKEKCQFHKAWFKRVWSSCDYSTPPWKCSQGHSFSCGQSGPTNSKDSFRQCWCEQSKHGKVIWVILIRNEGLLGRYSFTVLVVAVVVHGRLDFLHHIKYLSNQKIDVATMCRGISRYLLVVVCRKKNKY